MFCLRSWIPILFFLTNASPIYLVLFISATYLLNRPCVYCSLLLAILVLSLFDFHTDDWFEPRYKRADSQHAFFYAGPTGTHNAQNGTSTAAGQVAASAFNASMMLPDVLVDTVAMLSALVNASVRAAVESVVSTAKGALPTALSNSGESATTAANVVSSSGMVEWMKALLRKEWRIECLDLVVRL